jgi:hypothetical protein
MVGGVTDMPVSRSIIFSPLADEQGVVVETVLAVVFFVLAARAPAAGSRRAHTAGATSARRGGLLRSRCRAPTTARTERGAGPAARLAALRRATTNAGAARPSPQEPEPEPLNPPAAPSPSPPSAAKPSVVDDDPLPRDPYVEDP